MVNRQDIVYAFGMNRHVPLDRKLAVLQEHDTHRKWYSLDDERVCILCERRITGRMIDIWETRKGVFHLHCPTPGCDSVPRDWFYHGVPRQASVKVLRSQAPIIEFGGAAAA
jgi:hypothetical protein